MYHMWNNGMLEYWNGGGTEQWSVGILGGAPCPSFHNSIVPSFQGFFGR
jgi:hypothetical protein